MKKILYIFIVISSILQLNAQTPMTLSLSSNSGAFSITCGNPTITITASTNYTAGFVTYTMNAGSYTATGQTFNINTPGNYTITGFATNSINATQTLVVGINTISPLSIISPLSQTISCANPAVTSVSAIGTPTNNILHQFIAPQGGTLSANSYTAIYVPGPGTYTHVLIDLSNGCKTTKTFTVQSGPGFPSYNISSPQNFSLGCASKSLAVVNIFSGGANSYTVLSPSAPNSYSTSNQTNYSITIPGTYTVVGKDINSGCETKTPISIIQNTTPPNIVTTIPTQTLNCNTPSITITAGSPQNVTYNWLPGSFTVNSVNVQTTANASNTLITSYTLMLMDLNNFCTNTSIIPMYQNIFAPNALISNGAANSITSCITPTIILQNQSTTGIPANSGFSSALTVTAYVWNAPSPQLPASNTSTYAAYTPGSYTLVVKDLNNGCFSSTVTNVSDHRIYPPVNNPTPFCFDSPSSTIDIYANVSGSSSGFSYFWTSPPAAFAPGVNSPTLITNAVGVYTLSVKDPANGCASIANVTVMVCTGLEKNSEETSSINIYPNPSNGFYKVISNNFNKNVSIEIYDILGVLIQKQTLVSETSFIDLQSEKSGVYFLYVIENNLPVKNIKIIKE